MKFLIYYGSLLQTVSAVAYSMFLSFSTIGIVLSCLAFNIGSIIMFYGLVKMEREIYKK